MSKQNLCSGGFVLTGLLSFTHFIEHLQDSLYRLRPLMVPALTDYARALYERRAAISARISTNSLVHTHRWSNGESKTAIDPLLAASLEDRYWAKRYPFCSGQADYITTREGTQIASFPISKCRGDNLEIPCIRPGSNSTGVLISHVNHFGHFVLDTLPLLLWIKTSDSMRNIYGLNPGLSNSILNEFSHLITCQSACSPIIVDIPDQCQVGNVMSLCSTSPIVSQYLLRKTKTIYLRSPLNIPSDSLDFFAICECRKFFVTRGHHGSSRIHNYHDIARLLIDQGFCPIDLGAFSLQQIALVLRNASVIVAECGTASHLSAVFSGSTTRMVCLVPERLFLMDDQSFIFGCFSYYCGYLDKASFVRGQTVVENIIPTSDLVHYGLQALHEVLGSL